MPRATIRADGSDKTYVNTPRHNKLLHYLNRSKIFLPIAPPAQNFFLVYSKFLLFFFLIVSTTFSETDVNQRNETSGTSAYSLGFSDASVRVATADTAT